MALSSRLRRQDWMDGWIGLDRMSWSCWLEKVLAVAHIRGQNVTHVTPSFHYCTYSLAYYFTLYAFDKMNRGISVYVCSQWVSPTAREWKSFLIDFQCSNSRMSVGGRDEFVSLVSELLLVALCEWYWKKGTVWWCDMHGYYMLLLLYELLICVLLKRFRRGHHAGVAPRFIETNVRISSRIF